MSVNKYMPHLLVLPEDDANRQLANGFVLEVDTRQIQILPEAGGWHHVCRTFETDHVPAMRQYLHRSMVLLIDFDTDPHRLSTVLGTVPGDLAGRVFVLGAWTEPEVLKAALGGSYEAIGRAMANDCFANTQKTWSHDLLIHNEDQLGRLRRAMVDVLR